MNNDKNEVKYFSYEEYGSYYIEKITKIDNISYNCKTYSYHSTYENFDNEKVVSLKDIIIPLELVDNWHPEFNSLDTELGEKIFNNVEKCYNEFSNKVKEINKQYNKKIKKIITKNLI